MNKKRNMNDRLQKLKAKQFRASEEPKRLAISRKLDYRKLLIPMSI